MLTIPNWSLTLFVFSESCWVLERGWPETVIEGTKMDAVALTRPSRTFSSVTSTLADSRLAMLVGPAFWRKLFRKLYDLRSLAFTLLPLASTRTRLLP